MIKIKNNWRYRKVENKKEQKAKEKIWKIIKDKANWFNDKGEKENQEARKRLIELYKEYKAYKSSEYYETAKSNFTMDKTHISYIYRLIKIKEALDEHLYMRACNDIEHLIWEEPIFQRRIQQNLLNLLETTLNIKMDEV